jgi:nucleoside-diphosphate kinase
MANLQQTFVIIKPDAMVRNLAGLVLNKLSETKLKLIAAKLVKVSPELAKKHYAQLSDKPFFPELIDYIQGKLHNCDAVLALVYQGPNAVEEIRKIAGATNPEQAEPASLRGSLGRITSKGRFENVIHASSDPSEAEREIKLWFKPEEITVSIYPDWK